MSLQPTPYFSTRRLSDQALNCIYQQSPPLSHYALHYLSLAFKVTAYACGAMALTAFFRSSPKTMHWAGVTTGATCSHLMLTHAKDTMRKQHIEQMDPRIFKDTHAEVETLIDQLEGFKTFLGTLNDSSVMERIASLQSAYLRDLDTLYQDPTDAAKYVTANQAYDALQEIIAIQTEVRDFLSDNREKIQALGISTEDWNLTDLALYTYSNYVNRPVLPQPPQSNNLITNPLFMQQQEGWTTVEGKVTVSSDTSLFGGRQVLKLDGDGSGTQVEQQVELPPHDEGFDYTLTLYVRNSDPAIPATVTLSGDVQYSKTDSWSDSKEWRPVQFKVFSTGGTVTLTLSVSDGGLAYFHGIELSQTDEIKPVPARPIKSPYHQPLPVRSQAQAGDNLLTNAQFFSFPNAQNAPYYPWVLDPNPQIMRVIDGGNSRGLLLDTATLPGVTARAAQEIPFALPPTTAFTITGQVWLEGKAAPKINILYNKHIRGAADQKQLILATTGDMPTETGRWCDFSFTFQTEDWAQVTLQLYLDKYSPGKAIFKNLSLMPKSAASYDQLWLPTSDARGPKRTTLLASDFTTGIPLHNDWLIYRKAWGIANTIPSQVALTDAGLTLTSSVTTTPSGALTRAQGCIVSKSYFGSARIQVTASFPAPLPSGHTFAIWNFSWQELASTQAEAWQEPSPERNTELDMELGTDDMAGVPPSHAVRTNTYGGQLGGEPNLSERVDLYSFMQAHGVNIYDGKPHRFEMVTVSGNPGEAGYVAWLCDGHEYKRIQGNPYGQDYIPRAPTRVCIGLENPSWAGPLDPTSIATVTVHQVSVTPLSDGYPVQKDLPYADETVPNGIIHGGDSFFAWPVEYPVKGETLPEFPLPSNGVFGRLSSIKNWAFSWVGY